VNRSKLAPFVKVTDARKASTPISAEPNSMTLSEAVLQFFLWFLVVFVPEVSLHFS
jgi:hypothetical protein